MTVGWGETSDPAVAEFAKDKFGQMIRSYEVGCPSKKCNKEMEGILMRKRQVQREKAASQDLIITKFDNILL